MYVCLYVCMYVCMIACVCGCIDMDRWKDVCVYLHVYRGDGMMYVYKATKQRNEREGIIVITRIVKLTVI